MIIYDLKLILPKNIFLPPKIPLEAPGDTSKMHFSASSQWSKICFGYQGIIFNRKNESVSLTVSSQFFFDDFPKNVSQKLSYNNIPPASTDNKVFSSDLLQLTKNLNYHILSKIIIFRGKWSTLGVNDLSGGWTTNMWDFSSRNSHGDIKEGFVFTRSLS